MGLREHKDSGKQARLIVGARVGWAAASVPFGRITADSQRIVVSAVTGRVELHREHVIEVYTIWFGRTVTRVWDRRRIRASSYSSTPSLRAESGTRSANSAGR